MDIYFLKFGADTWNWYNKRNRQQ